jgi:hypothetical protein
MTRTLSLRGNIYINILVAGHLVWSRHLIRIVAGNLIHIYMTRTFVLCWAIHLNRIVAGTLIHIYITQTLSWLGTYILIE